MHDWAVNTAGTIDAESINVSMDSTDTVAMLKQKIEGLRDANFIWWVDDSLLWFNVRHHGARPSTPGVDFHGYD